MIWMVTDNMMEGMIEDKKDKITTLWDISNTEMSNSIEVNDLNDDVILIKRGENNLINKQ